ncbi:hypothetical protein NPX13_g4419 [Xylaria arbuscula]|uniref:Uncharacterized protein n=1 Tax=Xylaria arbuscula TaxID=114810 RepID=A0A9W8NGV4_9PEZI|nr:hypothetical protein NPX13_g4419 [Xylaria arbuscula]
MNTFTTAAAAVSASTSYSQLGIHRRDNAVAVHVAEGSIVAGLVLKLGRDDKRNSDLNSVISTVSPKRRLFTGPPAARKQNQQIYS